MTQGTTRGAFAAKPVNASGGHSLTLTTTGATNVTLPTSGTLGTAPTATTSGRVVLANGASTTVTHSADASNLRRAKFYEYVPPTVSSSDNPVLFQADWEGTNGATSFTDQSVYWRTVTFSNASISSSQAKHGSTSLFFGGTTSYVSVPAGIFAFGTSDFTFETYFRITTASANFPAIFDARSAAINGAYPALVFLTTTTLSWFIDSAAKITTGTLSTGVWYHVAVVRSGSTTTMYLDGVSQGTWSDSTNYIATNGWIGRNANYPGTDTFRGFMDGTRCSLSAVYTGTFTPPGAHPAITSAVATLKPRAESVVTIQHDDGAGANRSTKTTATNTSGGTLQGELIVVQ